VRRHHLVVRRGLERTRRSRRCRSRRYHGVVASPSGRRHVAQGVGKGVHRVCKALVRGLRGGDVGRVVVRDGGGSRERLRNVQLLLTHNVVVLLEGATLLGATVLEPDFDLKWNK
jgi:hypothetical protein